MSSVSSVEHGTHVASAVTCLLAGCSKVAMLRVVSQCVCVYVCVRVGWFSKVLACSCAQAADIQAHVKEADAAMKEYKEFVSRSNL